MTAHTVVQHLLGGIELRERRLAEQVGELAVRLRELEAEREALAITGKTIRAMAPGPGLGLERPAAPVLPDGVVYQQIMEVFGHERRALDLPLLAKQIEGTRAKLKHVVSLGLLGEAEPGLFAQPRPAAQTTCADQRP